MEEVRRDTSKSNRSKFFLKLCAVLAVWAVITFSLQTIFAPERPAEIPVAIMTEETNFLGTEINTSIIIEWGVILVCVIAALLIRFLCINKFSEKPAKGLQNALEYIVQTCEDYANKYVHNNGFLGGYIFALGVFLICSAVSEVLGFHSPAADIKVTGALGICTFILVNYYGIRKLGFVGRLKWFLKPMPLMLPINIITQCVIPVSLACRLFGNMVGGMIILEILYYALGVFGVGMPAVIGLFFSVFHPIIQAYIFITLTLTFISEAVETME